MHKWSLHCPRSKSRLFGLRLQSSCIRQLSGSTIQAQEPQQDTYGHPPRRDQHRDVTDRVSQHFQRTDHSRQEPQSRPNLYYRSLNLNAVDARDLAAPPNSSSRPPRRTTGGDRASASRPPLDDRNLHQRPKDGPRISYSRVGPDRDSQDIQSARNPLRRDTSDRRIQGGTSGADHDRNRAPPGRKARPPASGRSGGPKKRERASGSTPQAASRSKEVGDEPSEEELAYLKSRDSISMYSDRTYEGGAMKYINAIDVTYTPAETSVDTLQGMGPALVCGQRGMSETVGERLIQINKAHDEYDERIQELAQKFGEGEFCRFRSKQERTDTLKIVTRNLAGQGDNAKLDEGKEKEKMELMDTRMAEERAKLATRLLKGDYYVGPLGKGPTAELLERYTSRNETYLPKDTLALAGKVRTLLPLDQAATKGSRSRA
ncbi:MAG: hypothetical protein Q9186_003471 [Xanthomendoza sp. 1 TL-2023]